MDEVERLVEAIIASGVKHAWLAYEAGISTSTLSRTLNHEKKTVDVRLFVRRSNAARAKRYRTR